MKRSNYQKSILQKLTDLENQVVKNSDKPFTLIQAAEYLGLSTSYLYKLTSKNLIPHHKPTGKVIFFSKNELDEWVFNNKTEEAK
ncbi:MAG: DNA-binding protein [Ignavibacteriae bacterium]|nr:DNA-binding protein [Ignavibacteriota bacterium]